MFNDSHWFSFWKEDLLNQPAVLGVIFTRDGVSSD